MDVVISMDVAMGCARIVDEYRIYTDHQMQRLETGTNEYRAKQTESFKYCNYGNQLKTAIRIAENLGRRDQEITKDGDRPYKNCSVCTQIPTISGGNDTKDWVLKCPTKSCMLTTRPEGFARLKDCCDAWNKIVDFKLH